MAHLRISMTIPDELETYIKWKEKNSGQTRTSIILHMLMNTPEYTAVLRTVRNVSREAAREEAREELDRAKRARYQAAEDWRRAHPIGVCVHGVDKRIKCPDCLNKDSQ